VGKNIIHGIGACYLKQNHYSIRDWVGEWRNIRNIPFRTRENSCAGGSEPFDEEKGKPLERKKSDTREDVQTFLRVIETSISKETSFCKRRRGKGDQGEADLENYGAILSKLRK